MHKLITGLALRTKAISESIWGMGVGGRRIPVCGDFARPIHRVCTVLVHRAGLYHPPSQLSVASALDFESTSNRAILIKTVREETH